MQKFHSKMTPRSLYTQSHLTEITYAKVCIKEQPLLSVCSRLVSFRSRPISIIFALFFVRSRPIIVVRTFVRGRILSLLSLWCETADFCPDVRVEREARIQLG